jgi:hypothetical protein
MAPGTPLGPAPLRWAFGSRPVLGLPARFRPQSFAWGYPQRLLGDCHLLWRCLLPAIVMGRAVPRAPEGCPLPAGPAP